MASKQKSNNRSWATKEFSKIGFKNKRLNQRCQKLASALEQQSTEPINQACKDWADTKAAYRFFDNEKVSPDKILAPHYQQTVKRMKPHALVLAVLDTSFFNDTHHPQTEGLGEIGTKAQNQRGFGMHSTLAVTPQGLPLGLLTQLFFERPIGEASHTASEIQKLPIEEKESYRWIEAFEQVIAQTPEEVQVVTVCDREADFYEMFVMAERSMQTYWCEQTRIGGLMKKPNICGQRLKARERLATSRLTLLATTNAKRVKPASRFVFAPSP